MIRLAISADCHVTEPLDLWKANLPASLRGRGPRIERRDGRSCFIAEGRIIRKFPAGSRRSTSGEAEEYRHHRGMASREPWMTRGWCLPNSWGILVLQRHEPPTRSMTDGT